MYNHLMESNLQKLKDFITEKASNEEFAHHKWFVRWHLEIVEDIAMQLVRHYPEADTDIVSAMVWMHDYGKIVDFDGQFDEKHTEAGRDILVNLGFDPGFAERVAENIRVLDRKENLHEASIETQIVSSADACSHLVGPFVSLYWRENPHKEVEETMAENVRKFTVDWDKKVTLSEARDTYQALHDMEIKKAKGVVTSL